MAGAMGARRVNYYQHHLGDYAAATVHLSWDEDAAYRRLIAAYYHQEAPIPADLKAACRLVRAATPSQREAVKTVLSEFFELGNDGWRQKRCDAEIARANDKQNKAKRSASARWSNRVPHSEGNANALHEPKPDAMRTHSEGNAPNTQYPIPNTKTGTGGGDSSVVAPGETDPRPPSEADDPPPTPSLAGRACLACRGANVHDVNPAHPDLLRLLSAGVTPEEIGATAAECSGKGKARFAYVLATVERRRSEAAHAPQVAAARPVTVPSTDRQAEAFMAAMDERSATATRPPAALLALAERIGR